MMSNKVSISSESEFRELHLNCDICSKVFESKEDIAKHVRMHEGNYICQLCSKGFASEVNLSRHSLMQHGRKKFYCAVCKQSFLLSSTYAKHVRKHVNWKPMSTPYRTMDVGQVFFKNIAHQAGTLVIEKAAKNIFVLNVICEK